MAHVSDSKRESERHGHDVPAVVQETDVQRLSPTSVSLVNAGEGATVTAVVFKKRRRETQAFGHQLNFLKTYELV